MKIAITGKIEGLTRNEIIEKLSEHRIRVVSKVNRTVDALLVGENTGSKLTVAKSLGIKIITLKNLPI